MKVQFMDSGREPRCIPDPAYPNGMFVDMSNGASITCMAIIPYPAPRCGAMLIHCETCGRKVAVTVAGRIDDPHTVKVACKGN